MRETDSNIVLIGMPGVGKSTIGVLLAKTLSREFLDTDVYIQAREGRRLQEIIDDEGLDAFLAVEERHILALRRRRHVIATGGSVVYSGASIRHLAEGGVVVLLELSLATLAERLRNLSTRGVVMAAGQSLESLYAERRSLYERYAGITVDCNGLTHEGVVERIVAELERKK
jgi:shikimate kinase